MSNLRQFDYTFIDNDADQTLFLLHGTGGTKEDFLFFNKLLHYEWNIVSLQGNESENGMARFFKRIAEGVFDQENIQEQSEKLHQFIKSWMTEHGIEVNDLTFLGYSNGANMLLATMLKFPESIKNVVLLHPMLPFEVHPNTVDLANVSSIVTIGLKDPMIPHTESLKVVKALTSNGANPLVKEYETGHEITKEEMRDIVTFLRK